MNRKNSKINKIGLISFDEIKSRYNKNKKKQESKEYTNAPDKIVNSSTIGTPKFKAEKKEFTPNIIFSKNYKINKTEVKYY